MLMDDSNIIDVPHWIDGEFVTDVSTENYWSVGDIQIMAFSYDFITCSVNNSLHYKTDSGWLDTNAQGLLSSNFNPASITRTFDSDEIEKFRVINSLNCIYPDWIDSMSVSGTVKTIVSPDTGAVKILTNTSKVNENNFKSKKSYLINVYEFSADSIESKLQPNSSNVAKLLTFSVFDLDFKIHVLGETTELTNTQDQLTTQSAKFTVIKDVIKSNTVSSASSYEPLEILSVKSAFSCSLARSSCSTGAELINGSDLVIKKDSYQQILVVGMMHNYDTQEMPPQIKVLDSSSSQKKIVTMTFDKWVGDNGQFKALLYLDNKSKSGDWIFKMIHDSRPTSTRTITIHNTINDVVQSPNVFSTKIGVGYTNVYSPIVDGIKLTPVIDTGRSGITSLLAIPKLDIVNDANFKSYCEMKPFDVDVANLDCGLPVDAGTKQLEEIRLYPLILPTTADDAFVIQKVNSSKIKAEVSVKVGSVVKPVGTYNVLSDSVTSGASIQCGLGSDGNADESKCLAYTRGISLGKTVIDQQDINLKVFSMGLDKSKQHNILVTAKIVGNYELLAKDGVKFGGSIPSLTYSWSALYQDADFKGNIKNRCSGADLTQCCSADQTPILVGNTVSCQAKSCGILESCEIIQQDTDKDGFPDDNDSCPTVYSTTNNGCLPNVDPVDTDGDGTPDKRDACIYTFGLTEYDGCPKPEDATDTDGDGIPDVVDMCPTVHAITDNGCPSIPYAQECELDSGYILNDNGVCVLLPPNYYVDSDGDGIYDNADLCPYFAGFADNDGCPYGEPIQPLCESGVCDDGKKPKTPESDKICYSRDTGEQVNCPVEFSDYILYGAVGVAVLGLFAFIIKRRN